MSRIAAATFLAIAAFLVLTPASRAKQEWGTIKGQVVWAPDKLPTPVAFPAPAGTPACANVKGGNILLEPYVVDPKSKGMRWVVVWLMDPSGDLKDPLPIHPDLKAVPDDKVVLDQPCCTFEPPVVCLREGQKLIARNSAAFAHNTNIQAAGFNELIAPGAEKEIPAFPPEALPVPVACNIHPWMNARVAVFKHPYFAVTDADGKFEIKDAPAGRFLLVAWHGKAGFVNNMRLNSHRVKGDPIEIKANDVTEVKFEFTPKEDN